MSKPKVQSIGDLEDEMRAVVRGERLPPKDAAAPSYNSSDVFKKVTADKARKVVTGSRPRSHHPEE